MSRTLLLVILAVAPLGACKKSKQEGATCKDVGDAFLELSHRQLDDAKKAGTVDRKTHASVESHLPAMRDSMVRACEESEWSTESRTCFAGAASDASMMSCYATLAPEQQALLEKGFSNRKD